MANSQWKMEWTLDDSWILITAVCSAASCAMVGSFLVLRRQSMAGDALGHSLLPGLVLGYLIAPEAGYSVYFMFAILVALAALYAIEWFKNFLGLGSDAAIGIVYTAFFSLGVILVSNFAGNVHLDLDAVLMGELLFIPFNTVSILGFAIPQATGVLFLVMMGCLLFLFLTKRILYGSILDREFYALNFSKRKLIEVLSIVLTAIVVVASFEAVGSILVVAFLAGGPAVSLLMVNSVPKYIAISVLYSVLAASGGLVVAYLLGSHPASSMAAVSGVGFLAVFLLRTKLFLV